MPTKKTAPKKVVAKPTAKKPTPAAKTPAKKVAPSPVSKSAAKKPASKPTAKPVAKPAAKQITKKPAAKQITKKPAAKPVTKTPTPKPVAKPITKNTSKPAAKPAPAKKAEPKATAKPAAKAPIKPAAKVVAKKAEPKKVEKVIEPKKAVAKPVSKLVKKEVEKVKPAKKEVVVEKPVTAKPAKAAKKAPTKTLISSTNLMPKKSDVYKTNTFASNTLKNDTGKVIAHRKTSELKRKNNDLGDIKKYEPEFTRSILDMSATNDGPSFRYSDDDLAEFRDIIVKKLETAKAELQYLQGVIMRKDEGGTEDTENKYQNIEDGGASMEREQFNQLASRQITFIGHLEQALVRIENKTYGICRETGKLIDKARLRAVPHATLSIEAKNAKKA